VLVPRWVEMLVEQVKQQRAVLCLLLSLPYRSWARKRVTRPYGHEVNGLGCLGYRNITQMAATWTKARKFCAFFS
jgi:hypothetical protein